MTFERTLVEQCAPTLARIKTGSLFMADCGTEDDLQMEFIRCRNVLTPRDVHIVLMRVNEGKALVYVYRGKRLEQDLSCPCRREFLKSCGYKDFGAEEAVRTLRQRMDEGGAFPHEIGIFLGYPLGDVEGFVANCGKNCLLCGPWKVYSNVMEAQRQFVLLRKCTEIYRRLYVQGRSLERLTVAA